MNNFDLGIMKKYSNEPNEEEHHNHEMFDQALTGLLHGLEIHSGRLTDVTELDIISSSSINPDAFKYYYHTPEGIMTDLYKEIDRIFSVVENMLETSDPKKVLTELFTRLGHQPVMLKIIFIVNDSSIWGRSLRKIVRHLTPDWNNLDDVSWEYLYVNFCFQFETILRKWYGTNFSDEYIKRCVYLANLWLRSDGDLANYADPLLQEWPFKK